jgi:DNA-directed RNA polymerase subunit N
MIFPVRCFTCNKVIGGMWKEYETRTCNGEHPKDVMDKMGIKRYCCRRMFLGHVEIIDRILRNESLKESL